MMAEMTGRAMLPSTESSRVPGVEPIRGSRVWPENTRVRFILTVTREPTSEGECGELGGDHATAGPVVRGELEAVPGGRAQVRDDDVLLLRADIVGDDAPGGLALLLVLDDVVVDGAAAVRPPVQVQRDERAVGCNTRVQVNEHVYIHMFVQVSGAGCSGTTRRQSAGALAPMAALH